MTLPLILNINDWRWDYLSAHPRFTIRDIERHPELPWKWNNVAYNPNLRLKDVNKHHTVSWDFYFLSHNSFEHSDELRYIKATIIANAWRNYKTLINIRKIVQVKKTFKEIFPSDILDMICLRTLQSP